MVSIHHHPTPLQCLLPRPQRGGSICQRTSTASSATSPASPGIHRLHHKLPAKSTAQIEIKWTKPGLSIPLHHPQQPHLLNCTSDSFHQSSDQGGDHFTKKASSKGICNSMDAGPEMTSICPALSMPKQCEVWLSCHCRPVRNSPFHLYLKSPFLLSRNCLFPWL